MRQPCLLLYYQILPAHALSRTTMDTSRKTLSGIVPSIIRVIISVSFKENSFLEKSTEVSPGVTAAARKVKEEKDLCGKRKFTRLARDC